ncbi:phosphate uptake regulator PhoU [Methanobacterium alkalithermotolerans]|uniref:Phosphate-specific transport system accessory protein PhoU n=1 Tax=Methanobacterium alkalithermotolerans TaxID=2731220 RepID=A0A8T8K547_9EURY|nr:phosphate uptake regulator PhoU [Methanobacterium alkalithermotolerans]QUH23708.1 phosphate uptake regulator PhoU [Methanobacterium alkalithermotolerans]RJS49724.1 MAG: hypothetical protein CIT03_00895 [Methanobacterium sp.]
MFGVILDKKLSSLSGEVLDYGNQTVERIDYSVNSFIDENIIFAREIIEKTSQVNEASYRLEQECLKILGLHQPVGKDLRTGAALLRTAIELERINILAAYISRHAIDLKQKESKLHKPPHLLFMSQNVQGMLKDGMGALINKDIQLLKRCTKNYVTIQDLYNQMFAEYDEETSGLPTTYLMLVGRNLLSMGHHVMGMADRIAYMIVGKQVMHHKVFYNVLMK